MLGDMKGRCMAFFAVVLAVLANPAMVEAKYQSSGGTPLAELHSHCAAVPGAWVEKDACPEDGAYFFKFTAGAGALPADLTDGRGQTTTDVQVLMELRSPTECWKDEKGCTSQEKDLKDNAEAKESGYDVYVSQGCTPTALNYNAYMDTGVFQTKQISVAVVDEKEQEFYIAIVHRNKGSCNMTLSTGALYAPKGSAAKCTWLEEVSQNELLNKCTTQPSAFFAGPSAVSPGGAAGGGTPLAAIIVPVVLVVVVIVVAISVLWAKKKKKDARMGKFAALSKGGATGATATATGAMAEA